MTQKDQIITNYIDFFTAGCKKANGLKYGLEAEHIIVYQATKKAVPYFGEDGVCALLHQLSEVFSQEYWIDGHLLGLYNDEAAISLEPGSQLELSVTAAESITEIAEIYDKYYQLITRILKKKNQQLISEGYQPASLAAEIELLPKCRYTFMDEHFTRTGNRGINMMRGTASCQVILDYTSEQDFIDKYRSAAVLSPLLALLSSNSPVFEGNTNENPLIRTEIWRNVDPARCGIPSETFSADFSFRKYAEYIIGQDAIFEVENGVSNESKRKVSEILSEKPHWDEDYLLYLSLAFPDIRLRQYIEIRIADSMSAADTFAYMALIKGLFLDMNELNKWLDKFPQSIEAIKEAQDAIMKDDLNAFVYGEPVTRLLSQMVCLAYGRLGKEEGKILLKGFGSLIETTCNAPGSIAKSDSL